GDAEGFGETEAAEFHRSVTGHARLRRAQTLVRDRGTSPLRIGRTMRVCEGVTNRNGGLVNRLVRENAGSFRGSGRRELGERLALDVLKNENQRILVLEVLVGANDGGMAQFGE